MTDTAPGHAPEGRFRDIKTAFRAVTRDEKWLQKVLLGGFMLFLPGPFLFSLGFTMEVLRRAKNAPANFVLPSWDFELWPRYFREGLVKFALAIVAIIIPSLAWLGIVWLACLATGVPAAGLLPMALPILNFVALPFCAVCCCRYLDTGRLSAGLDIGTCLRIYRAGFADFSIGALILIGLITVGQSLIVTLPFVLFFGLCLVDNWFGPIYNSARDAAGVRPD
ncbi:MAG: DUF4013 domain-containing protein [Planctomycetota bacterium]|nr:DUF4013 domain-containing protein [Planctomycetota bacterium]